MYHFSENGFLICFFSKAEFFFCPLRHPTMSCVYFVASKNKPIVDVEEGRFGYLRNGETVRHWFQRAWQMRSASPEECFEPFIFAWIALNAWGECITNQEHDEDWVRSLAHNDALNRRFGEFLACSTINRRMVEMFRNYWPVPRVQVWRRFNDQSPQSNTSHDRARFFKERRIPCAPQCALQHLDAGQEVPLDWEHFLPAVYRVRCNLFHGDKSPYDLHDARIVHSSFTSLVEFMNELGHFHRRYVRNN